MPLIGSGRNFLKPGKWQEEEDASDSNILAEVK